MGQGHAGCGPASAPGRVGSWGALCTFCPTRTRCGTWCTERRGDTRGVRVRVAAQMRPVHRGSPRGATSGAAGSSVSLGARRARKGAQLRTCVPEGGGLSAGAPRLLLRAPWRHSPPGPAPPSPRQALGCVSARTASAARSQLAAQKLRARELWGSGLDAQTKSQSPRGHRPLYNSDIFMERV